MDKPKPPQTPDKKGAMRKFFERGTVALGIGLAGLKGADLNAQRQQAAKFEKMKMDDQKNVQEKISELQSSQVPELRSGEADQESIAKAKAKVDAFYASADEEKVENKNQEMRCNKSMNYIIEYLTDSVHKDNVLKISKISSQDYSVSPTAEAAAIVRLKFENAENTDVYIYFDDNGNEVWNVVGTYESVDVPAGDLELLVDELKNQKDFNSQKAELDKKYKDNTDSDEYSNELDAIRLTFGYKNE